MLSTSASPSTQALNGNVSKCVIDKSPNPTVLALRDAFSTNSLLEAHPLHYLNAVATKVKLKSVDAEGRVALDDGHVVAELRQPDGESIACNPGADNEDFKGRRNKQGKTDIGREGNRMGRLKNRKWRSWTTYNLRSWNW